jgi:hypothetical protein
MKVMHFILILSVGLAVPTINGFVAFSQREKNEAMFMKHCT